jgi:2-oxoglutarate ferredoxin oxidoreductase subunit beta
MEKKKELLTRKDFVSSSEVRWCPGCGDYSVLNSVQNVMPQLGIPKEKFVFVSGIGCSSRFPYYMDTYGFHSIHGRAPTIATGVKVANPELSVWVITGDGDGLSIGGNHLVHALRRNLDMNIILFNNKIYGLTKGQYSPTSDKGQVTKTSPYGVIDEPLNPLRVALASEATFVGRAVDTDPKHITEVLLEGAKHPGTAFVEIFQSCVIFNKDAWKDISDRSCREDRLLYLEQGKPLVFGEHRNKGIILKGTKPEVVTIGEQGITLKDLVVHDMYREDPVYAAMLTKMDYPDYPMPVGIFRAAKKQRRKGYQAFQRHSDTVCR